MINNIILSINKEIKDLRYVSKIGGLSRVQQKSDTLNGKAVLYRFPVYKENGHLVDATPDSRESAITFFENETTGLISRQGRFLKYSTSVRLICWLNSAKLDTCGDETSNVINNLVKMISNYKGKDIKGLNILESTPRRIVKENVFSRYTFNENQRQYLMPPFDAFAIDITFVYLFNTNCPPAICKINPPC